MAREEEGGRGRGEGRGRGRGRGRGGGGERRKRWIEYGHLGEGGEESYLFPLENT